jgi:hypothetical protein
VGAFGLTCLSGAQAASGISCTAGPDCDAKWARARQWITDNSKYPIKVDTDTEISTVTRTEFRDPALIATVNRFLRKDGTFDITLRVGCGMLFGACRPSVEEAHESFSRYVMLSSNAPVPAATWPAGSAVISAAAGQPKTAETSVERQPAPGGSVPVAAGTGENPDDMLLFCRGGGPMMLRLIHPPPDSGGDVVLLELSFQRAAQGARQAPLAAGECAFVDRALRENEPSLLSVSGPTAGVGLDMHLSSNGQLTSYAIAGTGRVHDLIGLVANGVLNKTDFSLHVSNVGTQRLRALVR